MKANLNPQITQITQISVLATDEAWSDWNPVTNNEMFISQHVTNLEK